MQIKVDIGETTGVDEYLQSQRNLKSAEKETLNEEVQRDGFLNPPVSNQKERKWKRKRKHGNKGRVPWNKGRKHTAETRALIKQRTIEALRNPQVRKKMSESSRAHSEKNKAKISSSLRRIWEKRLKLKRLRERFFLSWAESIAEAAKKGSSGQEELDWDSYERIKQEMTLQLQQRATDKARCKELAKIEAKRAAQAKAEKRARLVQKKKKWEAKAKSREMKRGARRKLKKNAEDSSDAEVLTLKHKLTKIRKKKSVTSHLIGQSGEWPTSRSLTWERLDVELIKREKVQNETSLADQIRAAKNRRAELNGAWEALAAPSNVKLFT